MALSDGSMASAIETSVLPCFLLCFLLFFPSCGQNPWVDFSLAMNGTLIGSTSYVVPWVLITATLWCAAHLNLSTTTIPPYYIHIRDRSGRLELDKGGLMLAVAAAVVGAELMTYTVYALLSAFYHQSPLAAFWSMAVWSLLWRHLRLDRRTGKRDRDLLEIGVGLAGYVACISGLLLAPSVLRLCWDRWWTILALEVGVFFCAIFCANEGGDKLKCLATRWLPTGVLTSVLQMNVRILYHMAAYDVAGEKILGGEGFKPGTSGLAGAGIYFATTNSDCVHKARAQGSRYQIIQTRVWLGRVYKIPPHGQTGITLASLKNDGYDSVLIPRQGGDEFVVYDPAQAVPLSAT